MKKQFSTLLQTLGLFAGIIQPPTTLVEEKKSNTKRRRNRGFQEGDHFYKQLSFKRVKGKWVVKN